MILFINFLGEIGVEYLKLWVLVIFIIKKTSPFPFSLTPPPVDDLFALSATRGGSGWFLYSFLKVPKSFSNSTVADLLKLPDNLEIGARDVKSFSVLCLSKFSSDDI